jgi:DNA polymerase-1
VKRPLLIIDGDSFAHRAYHGLPKSIRRRGNRGGGAVVGFANTLLRLYEIERPRAVLVGWDTLDVSTYRHQSFPAYQAGRQFDSELRDQLEVLPQLVIACGFVCAKSPGYEADDFLAAAVASEERHGGKAIVATGDRDAFQLASESTTILQPVRAGEMTRIGHAEVRKDMASNLSRYLTSLRSVATHRTSCRVRWESGLRVRPVFSVYMVVSMVRLHRADSRNNRISSSCTVG